MSHFAFDEEEDDDLNGNFSLDEYTEQERHIAEPAFIQPEPLPPAPKVVDQVAQEAKKLFSAPDSVDLDGNYLKISEDELKARANMQTKKLVAYIETGVTFANSILILKKGDNMTFDNYESESKRIEQDGETFEIDPESELAKVIERMSKYKKSQEEAKVDDTERKMIYDAIIADLRTQNNAKMLKRLSINETVIDIVLSKVAPNLQDKFLSGVQTLMNKF